MEPKKFAIFGCGFWSQFQLGAWTEISGAKCVALFNRTVSKADALAKRFNVPRVYGDAEELLKHEKLDFVDIITDVDTHAFYVDLAIKHGVKNIICQKPMGPTYEVAKSIMENCRKAGVNLYIHENFRWAAPTRRFKEILYSGVIGKPFKAKVTYLSGFDVYTNQPFLKDLDHFILTDIGSHILDVVRYLFGECDKLWCHTRTINSTIKGEDVATVMMDMSNGMSVYSEMSYASIVEQDCFAKVAVLVEGEKGSVYLAPDYEIRTTTTEGTVSERVKVLNYDWVDPDYIVIHSSGVSINQNILDGINRIGKTETTGDDNFETVKLVWACYESAAKGTVIQLNQF